MRPSASGCDFSDDVVVLRVTFPRRQQVGGAIRLGRFVWRNLEPESSLICGCVRIRHEFGFVMCPVLSLDLIYLQYGGGLGLITIAILGQQRPQFGGTIQLLHRGFTFGAVVRHLMSTR